jgi:U4/U6.U5 tri-snRNP-associated protein 3
MADNERSRDNYRERDSRREPREGRDRGGTPTERRNRSRSPQERGSRRDNRYRSRSPFRKDERENGGRGGHRGRGRGFERGRGGRDDRRGGGSRDERSPQPPKGPQNDQHAASNRGARPAPTAPRSTIVDPVKKEEEGTPDVEMKDERQKPEDMDDDEWEMLKVMGFGGFKSTKNTKVPGNDKNFGVRKDKQLQARQYMNRQGGFNRPLSPSRS